MNGWILLTLLLGLITTGSLVAQRSNSGLNSDPDVVYLDDHLAKPVELSVVTDARVFSDKEGKHLLGVLLERQNVKLEAMTDRAYKVRGEGSTGGIAGWVSPKAFESPDPDFVSNLKNIYQRQLQVQTLIANNEIAIGMNMAEVAQSLGEPTKKSSRVTAEGQSATWEFIDYDEKKHYRYVRNPFTGITYKQFSHTEIIEREKITLEFLEGIVTAIERSEDSTDTGLKIVVPPITFFH